MRGSVTIQGELSGGQLCVNFPGRGFSGGNFLGAIILGGNCPGSNFPGGNCPGRNYMGSSYPGGNYPVGGGGNCSRNQFHNSLLFLFYLSFFLSGFSLTNIYKLQDRRGRRTAFLLTTTPTRFTDT